MSFNDVYHDYIQDITMSVGRRFMPTKEISVEDVILPRQLVFAELDYNFEAENRAREAFENHNEKPPPAIPKRTMSKPSTPLPENVETKSSLTQEVLVPQPHPRKSVSPSQQQTNQNSSSSQNPTTSSHSFVDFEAHSTVFDDLELSALDEKKALQEILMPTNNNFVKSETPPVPPRKISQNVVSDSNKQANGTKQKDEDLKNRLHGKGYRSDIIELCLQKLPRSRFVHIEYYMKACRTIEKTGKSSIEASLDFLIDSQVTDKQLILKYSETSAHLLKMGFTEECSYRVTIEEQADMKMAVDKALLS